MATVIFLKSSFVDYTNDRRNVLSIKLLFIQINNVMQRKVYAKYLERKHRKIVESKLDDGQSGFRRGRSTTDQIFSLKQIFDKSWEYNKEFFACFVDLEKAYDRVSQDKLWKVLREYGVDGQL